ncbi:nicotinate (nicotinamide) nucleotide adenylyltransferase [Dysgonomonas sp. Marseille-Q5470]|uniref:nicotinate (nicotinamide) nucleotide adenylyltransferase n=1 Tax=Dysgonomonas sp. Marseille-Q5470 TaxID=3039494 RepID=UPI0024BD2561|nr:nicotinate (nicotinamide) nucleotide adenylyltransferase [Dysgonomonas sp. Marseille-Q5470]
MKIGIFSGSFNPIHVGHLILANYIVEYTDIEEVWLLVSPLNPLKSEDDLSDKYVRLEMTKLALEGYPKIKASDFEFDLPKPSYTINTLDALKVKYPEHDFTLVIGADNWAIFESWHETDKILENYKLKIYPRLGFRIKIPDRLKQKVEALDSPIIEISSTFIREGIEVGKNMRPFLTENVYDYIIEKGLYKHYKNEL